jgi:hypothetical protein
MNALPLSSDQKREVVAEGYRAFALQKELTEELAADFSIGDATEAETDLLLDELKADHP